MKPVFKDIELQNKFWEKGYVKIKLFSDDEIAAIKKQLEELQKKLSKL